MKAISIQQPWAWAIIQSNATDSPWHNFEIE